MLSLEKLNPQQQKAARHIDGPLLILAGAGSGKTATMTYRIANLIINENVPPYNILAVTFTNKAAQEMKRRVEDLVGVDLSMWIFTFHSACLRILRRHAELLGYSNSFAVYDPNDQKTVIRDILKEHAIDSKKYSCSYMLSVISKCKENFETPDRYIEINGRNPKSETIYKVYRDYVAILKKNNAMDFDDLLAKAVELFDKEYEILEKYKNRFQYVMVDEYQDTNRLQYRFVKALAEDHKNICVVGDDDQCIYQWRGADIRNILDFERDFKDARVVKLEENYRSAGNIIDGANSVISNNKSRKAKKTWTANEAGEKINYTRTENDKEEAKHVARIIEMMHDKGRKYKEFAILYRANAQSRNFEDVFSYLGLPYRVLGELRYYDRKEVKDIMCYMRLVCDPADDISLMRIINEPKRGAGVKTVEKLRALAVVRGVSMMDVLKDREVMDSLTVKTGTSLKELAEILEEYGAEKANLRVSDIYDGLLDKTGYIQALEEQGTVEADSRIQNLLEFRSVIDEYEKKDVNLGLEDFLEKITLMSDIDNHNEEEDAIVLMTMHSAKGLEFPVVFMPGMEDGLFPSWRSFDEEGRLEEERRLCYVGMTRAKERLFLSSAESRMMYGSINLTRESQFMREMDPALLEGDAVHKKRDIRKIREDGFANKNPFDPLAQFKKAKKQAEEKRAEPKENFETGDTVDHAKFGKGVVLEYDGKAVVVVFDDVGRKKLLAEMAPMKKTGGNK